MFEFYSEIARLKTVVRRGWELRNIKGRQESDAEHTFSMMMVALNIFAKNDVKVNQLKVLKMIAYHELCEIYALDVTPADHVDPKEKYENELKAITKVSEELNLPEVLSLWLEFEECKTEEAKLVKAIDKADCVFQSSIYAKNQNYPELFEEFSTSLRAKEALSYLSQFKF